MLSCVFEVLRICGEMLLKSYQRPIRFSLCQIIGANSPSRNPTQHHQYNPGKDNHPNERRPHDADANVPIYGGTIHDWYPPLNDSLVLILLSIHTELRPSAWALRCSPFICKMSYLHDRQVILHRLSPLTYYKRRTIR
jgi:hypothetical protein